MVKFISISLIFGLIILVLCFIVNSVNGHPLFLKTIARASSGSSGLNSLNSYSGLSNQNSHNGNTAVNSNPLQGLINTKFNIVGRALIQIGEAFERYGGNTENSGSSPRATKNGNGESIVHSRISSTSEAPATFDIDANLDARLGDIESNIKPNGKKVKITTESSIPDEDFMSSVDEAKDSKDDDIDKGSIDDGDDIDKASNNDGDEKDSKDDGDEKDSKDDADEKDNKDDADGDKDEALKINLFTLNGGSSGNGFPLEESSNMKQLSTEKSDGELVESNQMDMKKVSIETSNGESEKDLPDEDINNEGSESSDNGELVNLDTTKDSGSNEANLSQNSNNINILVNTDNNGSKTESSGYKYEGSQSKSPGYSYDGGKTTLPREYKYNSPNANSPGYQYSRPDTILPGPGYTYQSVPNTQHGYNYQGPNFNPPGYNYQQPSNVKPNGYRYDEPVVTTASTNGYNYVQAGNPSSGVKINKIRSTTSGYHYPKPSTSFSGSFIQDNSAQLSPYYNSGQVYPNNNYRLSETVLNKPVPTSNLNSKILSNAVVGTVYNPQNSGVVNPSQILNDLNVNNAFNYQTAPYINTAATYQSIVPTFNAAPNLNSNIGRLSTLKINENVNSNLGTIPTTYGNTYNGNTANFNSRPVGMQAFNSVNTVPISNTNQRINSLLQSQQSTQYPQNPNLNVNQFASISGSSNAAQRPGLLQNQQSNIFLTNPVIRTGSSSLISNRPTSSVNSFAPNPNINQNSAISNPARPSFSSNVGQNLAQTQQIFGSNSVSINQNQNIRNPLLDNIAIIPSIVLNLNRPSSTTNKNQGQNIVENQRSAGTANANLQATSTQNPKKPEIDHFAIIPSLVRPFNRNKNTNVKTAEVQSQERSSLTNDSNFNLNLNSGFSNTGNNNNNNNNNQMQLQQQLTFTTNTAPARPSFAGNVRQSLAQTQQFSIPNSASINQNQNSFQQQRFASNTAPARPSFAGNGQFSIPNSASINQNQNSFQQQTFASNTAPARPSFAGNVQFSTPNSASINQNQNSVQQQTSNTSPNLLPNSFNQNQNFQIQNSVNNQNINRNSINGFSNGGRQNRLGGQSFTDSTIGLTGAGYNTVNGIGQTNQNFENNIHSSTQRTNGNNNNDADVSKSSINTLSALKNLTESEYYENGVKKLQYPKDDDDDVAFRSSSNNLLVGDIRRYRKEINPIQYNQQRL